MPESREDPLSLLRYIARLARLHLTPEEEERYSREFQAILDYVAMLRNLSVEGVEPTAHPFVSGMPVRPDEPAPFPTPQSLLEVAPQKEGPFFTVPRFLGEE